MAENYCGRSCEACELQTEINCPGCKNGPGSNEFDTCELASCCRIKMQSSCEECIAKDGCEKVQTHKTVPDYIRNSLSLDLSKIKRIKERAKYAGEFKKLFILGVISIIASFLTSDSIAEAIPLLGNLGDIVSTVCAILMLVSYFKLGSLIKEYKISAYCSIVSVVVSIVLAVLAVISIFVNTSVAEVLLVVGAIVLIVIDFMSTYKEFKGHSEILSGVDDDFAEKWNSLWYLFICSFIGIIFGLIIMFGSLMFGAIVIIVAAIVLVVVSIRKLIYLNKMNKLFEELEYKYKDVLIDD